MSSIQKIKTAFERNEKALRARPYIGRKTAVTRARLLDGLAFEIEEGPWKFKTDISEKRGGRDSAPNPGILGRGALASCLAMGYVMWAAKLNLPLTHVEVEVQADFDVRGEFGVADVPAGYTDVRYIVTIESPAPEEDIRRLLDMADRHSSYYDIFANPKPLRRETRIVKPQTEEPV